MKEIITKNNELIANLPKRKIIKFGVEIFIPLSKNRVKMGIKV
jgi:hypothetical protein